MIERGVLHLGQLGRLDVFAGFTLHIEQDQRGLQRWQAGVEGGVLGVAFGDQCARRGAQRNAAVRATIGRVTLFNLHARLRAAIDGEHEQIFSAWTG